MCFNIHQVSDFVECQERIRGVNLSISLAMPRTGVVCCSIAGYAAVRVAADQFSTLRRQPGAAVKQPLSPSFLRHADEQTVAGVAAVLKAVHDHDLAGTAFTEWGVIAGPCLMGRQPSVDAMARFLEEGAFAISPHLIPHESLHAISGTVSQALEIHGPNFGVSGGPGAAEDTILTAATLLVGNTLPGLWVLLTDYEREMLPLPADRSPEATANPPDCLGLALALLPGFTEGPVLEICPLATPPLTMAGETPASLSGSLVETFSRPTLPRSQTWRLRSGGWMRMRASAADSENGCE
jgi:hypothetical protein